MANKDNWITNVLLGILVLIALGAVLVLMESLVLPLVLALFLSYIFKPVVLYLRARRVPSAIALILVFVFIAAVFFGLGSLIYSSVSTFVQEFPGYQVRLASLLNQASITLDRIAIKAGVNLEGITLTDVVDVSAIGAFVTNSAGSFVGWVSNFVLVMLIMFFILAGTGDFISKVESAGTLQQSFRMASVLKNIDGKVRRYLIVKTLINLLSGVLTTVTLLILGVDFALLWGFITFLLNFIPTIGSIVTVVFPFTFALLQFDTVTVPLLVLIILAVMHNSIGNVLEPRYMAYSLDLSPLLVLVSLFFWGWIWGVWGMVLSVPIMSTIKIICENVESLEPVAIMMSGERRAKPMPKAESEEQGE